MRFTIINETFDGYKITVNGANNARAALENALSTCDDFRDTYADFNGGDGDAFKAFCTAAAARLVADCVNDGAAEITAFGQIVNGDAWRDLNGGAIYTRSEMRDFYDADYLPQVDDGDDALTFPAWLEEITKRGDFEKL